ncbi:hypothetical protein V8G54_013375 [Vigna mungo]|uniref:Uncharacterized protein n=1 Tax=Vigna mungo TaxID=3915 RepID=A0AAQ3NTK5_VIGMU
MPYHHSKSKSQKLIVAECPYAQPIKSSKLMKIVIKRDSKVTQEDSLIIVTTSSCGLFDHARTTQNNNDLTEIILTLLLLIFRIECYMFNQHKTKLYMLKEVLKGR